MKNKNLVITCAFAALVFGSCASYKSYKTTSDLQTKIDASKQYCNYSIPQTQIAFKVTMEKTTLNHGIYANRCNLLGLKNVITKDEVHYTIKDVQISALPAFDGATNYILELPNQDYKAKIDPYGQLKAIIYKEEGKGKNKERKLQNKETKNTNQETKISNKETENTLFAVQPIYEAQMQQKGMLETTKMSAEEVTKKIEQLKEKQIEILSGTIDGTYMNTTVNYMYKQLDEIINNYVSLFTGTSQTETVTYTYYVTPQKPLIVQEDLLMKITDNPISIIARFHAQNPLQQVYVTDTLNSYKGVFVPQAQMVQISIEGTEHNFLTTLPLNQYGTIKAIPFSKGTQKF